jgi:molybdate/tungstate transport system permease protein
MIAFAVLGSVIVAFLALPLLMMITGVDRTILRDTVLDPAVVGAIWLTLYAALIATVVGCLLGVPLAYFLARTEFPGKNVIESLIDLPIVVPHTAAGIALLFVFGRNFVVGKAFGRVGVEFVDSTAGIVIGMMFVSVPFLIDSAKEGFKSVDTRLEKAARTLGASPLQAFSRVSLPLAWRSILAGNIMMWARGISEFGAVIILTYHPMIAPVLIYERFETRGLAFAQPVAVLLIIVTVIVFIGLRILLHRREKP